MPGEIKSGLFTKAQEEFLEGNDVAWDDSRGRTLRTRMRARIKRTLRDFTKLASPNGVLERDIELLRESMPDGELETILAELVAFVYRVRPERIERIVEDGVRLGLDRFNPEYTVDDVSIPIQKRTAVLDRARQKIQTNDPLTPHEILEVFLAGELPADELRDYIQKQDGPPRGDYARRYR